MNGALARLVPIAIRIAIFEPSCLRQLQRLEAVGFVFHAEELLIGGIDAPFPLLIELADAHDDVVRIAVAAGLIFLAVPFATRVGARGCHCYKEKSGGDDYDGFHQRTAS